MWVTEELNTIFSFATTPAFSIMKYECQPCSWGSDEIQRYYVSTLATASTSIQPRPLQDSLTVYHLKKGIVTEKPLSFQGVEADELVRGFPPFPMCADNFPTRHPFRLTGNSRTMLALIRFLKKMCYWRETCWRKCFRFLNLQRGRFTSLYDIRVPLSHPFDPSLLVTYH